LSAFAMLMTITAVVIPVLLTTWATSASNIGTDCEKLGGFYVNHKVYKCELVK
jgi:hypothetical protein